MFTGGWFNRKPENEVIDPNSVLRNGLGRRRERSGSFDADAAGATHGFVAACGQGACGPVEAEPDGLQSLPRQPQQTAYEKSQQKKQKRQRPGSGARWDKSPADASASGSASSPLDVGGSTGKKKKSKPWQPRITDFASSSSSSAAAAVDVKVALAHFLMCDPNRPSGGAYRPLDRTVPASFSATSVTFQNEPTIFHNQISGATLFHGNDWGVPPHATLKLQNNITYVLVFLDYSECRKYGEQVLGGLFGATDVDYLRVLAESALKAIDLFNHETDPALYQALSDLGAGHGHGHGTRANRRSRNTGAGGAGAPLVLDDNGAADAGPPRARRPRDRDALGSAVDRAIVLGGAPAPARRTPLLFVYPFEKAAKDPVILRQGDASRLEEGVYLNDELINFRLRFVLDPGGPSPERQLTEAIAGRASFHVFSTHFFSKLVEPLASRRHGRGGNQAAAHDAGYENVAKWTRGDGDNLFEKNFILVPICESLHWSLAVVCNPGAEPAPPLPPLSQESSGSAGGVVDLAGSDDDDEDGGDGGGDEDDRDDTDDESDSGGGDLAKRPCIIFMDSLGMHDSAAHARHLREYLKREWKARNPDAAEDAAPAFTEATMPIVRPDVPRQNNGCDCGVFVLKYAEHWLANLFHVDGRDVSGACGAFIHRGIFSSNDVSALRQEMQRDLQTMGAKYAASPAGKKRLAKDLAALQSAQAGNSAAAAGSALPVGSARLAADLAHAAEASRLQHYRDAANGQKEYIDLERAKAMSLGECLPEEGGGGGGGAAAGGAIDVENEQPAFESPADQRRAKSRAAAERRALQQQDLDQLDRARKADADSVLSEAGILDAGRHEPDGDVAMQEAGAQLYPYPYPEPEADSAMQEGISAVAAAAAVDEAAAACATPPAVVELVDSD